MFEDLLRQLSQRKRSGKERLEELCGPHWGSAYKGEMKNDHGERTNRKLNNQPFYIRGHNGKMRKY